MTSIDIFNLSPLFDNGELSEEREANKCSNPECGCLFAWDGEFCSDECEEDFERNKKLKQIITSHWITTKTKTINMTKQEAISAMKQGAKLTHRFFGNTEWVTIRNSLFLFEDGVTCKSEDFWQDRKSAQWDEDWSIYEEYKNSGFHFI